MEEFIIERVIRVAPDPESKDNFLTLRTDGVITHSIRLGPDDEATVTLTTLIEAPNIN